MIFLVLYVLVASAAVFCLVFLTMAHNHRRDWFNLDLWPAVLCGVIWPIGGPIYAAYILAKLYADSQK